MEINEIIDAYLFSFKKELIDDLGKLLTSMKPNVTKWLKTKDLKEMTGISDGKLHQLRATGILPYTKIDGMYLYKLEDVNRMLDENYSKNEK